MMVGAAIFDNTMSLYKQINETRNTWHSLSACTAILSWNIVEKRIRELVAEERYLNQAEKEELENRYLESAAEELSDEENTADRAIADEEREIAESIQPVEESAEKVLTADDIQNI